MLSHNPAFPPLKSSATDNGRNGKRLLSLFDSIWHIQGEFDLIPRRSNAETFARLAPLFNKPGTRYEQTGDALSFSKKDAAAQDKMSIFDRGVLQIEERDGAPVLRYRLASRALLFCFLAPLLFLAFAQVTVAVGKLEASLAHEAPKKAEKQAIPLPQNPIDKALGSPAPEKPKKDSAKDKDKKPSPTASYVFAALFALLYGIGRILEARLIKRLFQSTLAG